MFLWPSFQAGTGMSPCVWFLDFFQGPIQTPSLPTSLLLTSLLELMSRPLPRGKLIVLSPLSLRFSPCLAGPGGW